MGNASTNWSVGEPEAPGRTVKDRRILLVDDDQDSLTIYRAVLEHRGHRVRTAGDGRAALAMGGAASPALVLLDLRLPGMDGFEILRRFRERDPALPILCLTADATPESRTRAMSLGCNRYLTKPLEPRALADVVEHTLSPESQSEPKIRYAI
jgi:DNA-binding response OmpR family regulator